MLVVNSLHRYEAGSPFLSLNLSLSSPLVPELHSRLCSLHHLSPMFQLGGGVQLELYQVRHDQYQHLYLSQPGQQEEPSVSDCLGLLFTITLTGLAIFLVVLALSFLATKMVVRSTDSLRLQDEDNLVEESEEEEEAEEETNENCSADIFIISDPDSRLSEPLQSNAETKQDRSTNYLIEEFGMKLKVSKMFNSIKKKDLKIT